MYKKAGMLVLLLLSVFLLSACGKEDKRQGGTCVYYVNKEETGLVEKPYTFQGSTADELIPELIEQMRSVPDEEEYRTAIPDSVEILNYNVDSQQLYLNFSEAYYNMNNITEILCRAAVVRTLVQIPEIDYVAFNVSDTSLRDATLNPVGLMTADSFVENPGEEINSYQRKSLTLYFANEAGDKLVDEQVTLTYSGNISVEKLVVEQLISGPSKKSSAKPTLPPETKLISISTKDGTCYVNFDEKFLDNQYEIDAMLPIYSVVDSLSEIPNISKVQFSINGKTDVKFRESVNLETPFERNLDVILTPEAKKEFEFTVDLPGQEEVAP